MANRIIVKRSSVADKVPEAGDLEPGELAVNLVDQKLYSKTTGGTVILVGSGLGGAGSVTSVAAITLGTTGTDLSSSVATGTTTAVITLQVPTASAANRGALSAADWTTFNNKQDATANIVTGTGTINEISYWTDPGTQGTLAVATYPSLTEVSYVKGVTSAVQAQINAKGVGTVTSVTSANADATVATTTTTPVITIVSAPQLTTTRAIYGNNFDGSAALTQVIAGTYGGTGVNNSTRTITYAGNVAFTGANNISFTTAGAFTYTLPGATGTLADIASVQTLTNKVIPARVQSVVSAATVTPNADTNDAVDITAQAAGLTLAVPSGTPVNFQKLTIRIKDNATARAITWTGTAGGYVAGGVALPTTTVLSKITTVGFIYNTANALNLWQCVAVSQEA